MSLSADTLKYVKTYQRIYKEVIYVARRRENDRIIQKSIGNSKTLWQIIKKESGNSFPEIENLFKNGLRVSSKPTGCIPTI
jgi:hypothetical protein